MKRVACAAAIALACVACAGEPNAPHGTTLHLEPLADLAQGADLQWLVDVRPKAIFGDATIGAATRLAFPKDRLEQIADDNGGVDVSALDALVVATYAGAQGATTLWLARGAVDPAAIQTSFKRRAESIDGRAIDRGPESSEDAIVREWATVGSEREQVATFGRSAAALEVGRFGPLRVAELFAQARLKRANPALRVPAMARVAAVLRGERDDDAPARAFALGPFEGEDAKALGGLVAACTAVALDARPTNASGEAGVTLTFVLLGAWDRDAAKAVERFRVAFDAMSAAPLARLAGLDRPITPPRVEAISAGRVATAQGIPFPPDTDAMRLTITVRASELARAIRAASGAEIREIMAY